MPAGEWNVSQLDYFCFWVLFLWGFSFHVIHCLDVKMDWCNTKIDGKQLDPHVIYKEMVRLYLIQLMNFHSLIAKPFLLLAI